MKFTVKYNTNFKLLLYEEVLLSTLISRGVHKETVFFTIDHKKSLVILKSGIIYTKLIFLISVGNN